MRFNLDEFWYAVRRVNCHFSMRPFPSLCLFFLTCDQVNAIHKLKMTVDHC